MEHQIPVNDMAQEETKTSPETHDNIPEPLREVGPKVSEEFNEFKASENWEKMLDGREKGRSYITENTGK